MILPEIISPTTLFHWNLKIVERYLCVNERVKLTCSYKISRKDDTRNFVRISQDATMQWSLSYLINYL